MSTTDKYMISSINDVSIENEHLFSHKDIELLLSVDQLRRSSTPSTTTTLRHPQMETHIQNINPKCCFVPQKYLFILLSCLHQGPWLLVLLLMYVKVWGGFSIWRAGVPVLQQLLSVWSSLNNACCWLLMTLCLLISFLCENENKPLPACFCLNYTDFADRKRWFYPAH